MQLTLLIFLVLVLSFVAWGALTELSFFGPGGVRSVYRWSAETYSKKWHDPAYSAEVTERLFLSPIRSAMVGLAAPRMLDLACGTGRLSLLVLKQDWFTGRIHGVDFSAQMLHKFRGALADLGPSYLRRVEIEEANLQGWVPTEVHAFHVITLCEVSELLSDFEGLVRKCTTCLVPGGLIVLTKPPDTFAWLFPGRMQSSRQMQAMLRSYGFERIAIAPWRWRYSVVHAWKSGPNLP